MMEPQHLILDRGLTQSGCPRFRFRRKPAWNCFLYSILIRAVAVARAEHHETVEKHQEGNSNSIAQNGDTDLNYAEFSEQIRDAGVRLTHDDHVNTKSNNPNMRNDAESTTNINDANNSNTANNINKTNTTDNTAFVESRQTSQIVADTPKAPEGSEYLGCYADKAAAVATDRIMTDRYFSFGMDLQILDLQIVDFIENLLRILLIVLISKFY
jgi:hypothetical protein